jgi:hypothetical protein
MSKKPILLSRKPLFRLFRLLILLYLVACSPERSPYVDKSPISDLGNSGGNEASPGTSVTQATLPPLNPATTRDLFHWELALTEAGCLFDSEHKFGIQIGGVPIASEPIWTCPRYTDLSHADLSRSNLEGARLTAIDLSGADLHGANLANAHMSGTKLVGANLAEANLTWAWLTSADLTNANLRSATLAMTQVWDATLTGADLTGADTYGLSPKPDPSEVIGYTPWR